MKKQKKMEELSQKNKNISTQKQNKSELLRKKTHYLFSSECSTKKKQAVRSSILFDGIHLLFIWIFY